MSVNKTFYSIGEVSTMCSVPIKTLRYYDEIGLLVPKHRNTGSNYRYYAKEQMLTLFIIRKLKFLGFALKDIKHIVYESDTATMEKYVRERLDEISKIIEDYKEQYTEGQFLLERLGKGKDILSYYEGELNDGGEGRAHGDEEIKVEDIPETDVIFTRRIKKDYRNIDVSLDRWFELFNMVSKYKLKITGPVTLTYHNYQLEQFFKNDCDLEISIQINKPLDKPEFKKIGGFKAVTAIHIGKNTEIINTHIKAIKWLNHNGYTICGPISEEYIISPIDINNEEEHITKIIIPVK